MFRRAAYFDITEEPLEEELDFEPRPGGPAVGIEEVPQPAAYAPVDQQDTRWLADSHSGRSAHTLFDEQWVDAIDSTTQTRPPEPGPAVDADQEQASVDVGDVALQRELDALLQAVGPPEAPEPRVGPEALAEAERAARVADRGPGRPARRPAPPQPAPPPVRASAPPAPPPPVDWSKPRAPAPPGELDAAEIEPVDIEPTPELGHRGGAEDGPTEPTLQVDQHPGANDRPAEPEVLVLELPDLPGPPGLLRVEHCCEARQTAPALQDFDLDFDADPTEDRDFDADPTEQLDLASQIDVPAPLAAPAPVDQPGPSRARSTSCEVRRRPGALVLLALAAVAAVVLAAGSLSSDPIAPSSVSPADRAQGGGQLHGKRAARPRRRASVRRRRRVARPRRAARPRPTVPAPRPPVRVAPRPVAPPPVRTPTPAPPAPAPAPAPRAVPKPAAPKAGPEFL